MMRSVAIAAVGATTAVASHRLISMSDPKTSGFQQPPPLPLPDTGVKQIRVHQCIHLNSLGFASAGIPNHITQSLQQASTGQRYNKIIKDDDYVILDVVRGENILEEGTVYALPRAGPRQTLHFDPDEVRAAVVTCGGLCPGLNDVIHHIVNTLTFHYGVKTIFGIRGGYHGLARGPETIDVPDANAGKGVVGRVAGWLGYRPAPSAISSTDNFSPILLTPKSVSKKQHEGGTMLGSSRGGFDLESMIDFLRTNKINQLYVIGGDGTHRGAYKLAQECVERGLNISVACVPKTIDNDIAIIDRSFGFLSAVEAAQVALKTAKTEAQGNMPNGIGVVKLMGRSAGFIATQATLASGDVDLCLIPEVPMVLEGPGGCLEHLRRRVKEQGHAVVVVAEGAGEDLLGESAQVDAGGNRKLPPVGEFLSQQISSHFRSHGIATSVKYIDPSYIVRACPANAFDSYQCFILAQAVVHGSMAGYTGFTGGLVNGHTVMIPIPYLVENSPRTLNPMGRTWERVLMITGQPNTYETPT